MHPRISCSIVVLLVVFLSFTSVGASQAGVHRAQDVADSPYDLINAVNALRTSYGLPPYSVNSILMAAAQGHADTMAATGRVSHTGAGGPSASERLLSLGYPLAGDLSLGGFKSENITSGNEGMPAQEAVNRWMGDALHLNTMISADLTEIGAGVTANAGRVYFVIDAARPTDSGIPQDLGTSVAGVPTTVPGVSAVIIPVVVVTPNENGDIIHEVKAGQSLWQIAISYNTRIDEIKRLNNLFDNNIYPGSKLLIKKGVPTSTAPSVITESQAISTLTQPTAIASITVTPTKTIPAAAPPNNLSGSTIGIAIGIIALAILGGGVFAWWGTKKEE